MELVKANLPGYTVDTTRRGAQYIYNGKAMNKGEFLETVLAEILTGKPHRKDSLPFDKGSDIVNGKDHISVKSNGCSITELITTTERTPQARQNLIKEYLNRAASNLWAFVTLQADNSLKAYMLDKQEFEKVLEKVAVLDKKSGVNAYKLRIKTTDKKIEKTIEAL